MEPAVHELGRVGRIVDRGLDRAGEKGGGPLRVRAQRDDRDVVLLRIESEGLQCLACCDVGRAAHARNADLLAFEIRCGLDLGRGHEEVREHGREHGGDRQLRPARGGRKRLGATDADELDPAGEERGHSGLAAVDRLQIDGETVLRENAGVHRGPYRQAVTGEVRVGGLHRDRRERRRRRGLRRALRRRRRGTATCAEHHRRGRDERDESSHPVPP